MTATPLSQHQLRFEVTRVHQKDPDALVIGMHAPGHWAGDDELELDDRRFAVVPLTRRQQPDRARLGLVEVGLQVLDVLVGGQSLSQRVDQSLGFFDPIVVEARNAVEQIPLGGP